MTSLWQWLLDKLAETDVYECNYSNSILVHYYLLESESRGDRYIKHNGTPLSTKNDTKFWTFSPWLLTITTPNQWHSWHTLCTFIIQEHHHGMRSHTTRPISTWLHNLMWHQMVHLNHTLRFTVALSMPYWFTHVSIEYKLFEIHFFVPQMT